MKSKSLKSLLCMALLFAGVAVNAQHGASNSAGGSEAAGAARKKRVLSNAEAGKLQCLDFGTESKNELSVIFSKDLSSDKAVGGEQAYVIANGKLVKSSRKTKDLEKGAFCELFKFSEQKELLTVKANTTYPSDGALPRMNGRKDSAGAELRGCRINMMAGGKAIGSLQCFVPGTGEATVGDLQKALGSTGKLQVRTR